MAHEEDKEIAERIRLLEHQGSTILFLSAFNLFINVVTILIAAAAVWF